MDNQLPMALAELFISRGHEAHHVLDFALDEASDSEIWKFAAENGFVLMTKDEDFAQRASLPNATVQIVWVRLGNCRKDVLLEAIDSVMSQMHSALESGNRVIEIR
ncbi:MAG: DUF5615 family PIN-like protein [Candidatus Acidiferrales bacterium]